MCVPSKEKSYLYFLFSKHAQQHKPERKNPFFSYKSKLTCNPYPTWKSAHPFHQLRSMHVLLLLLLWNWVIDPSCVWRNWIRI